MPFQKAQIVIRALFRHVRYIETMPHKTASLRFMTSSRRVFPLEQREEQADPHDNISLLARHGMRTRSIYYICPNVRASQDEIRTLYLQTKKKRDATTSARSHHPFHHHMAHELQPFHPDCSRLQACVRDSIHAKPGGCNTSRSRGEMSIIRELCRAY
ncbi:hypothetical protein K402DRAFT_44927 [Aulographum hederae CBS 113979]|uniref:Uncharacterized protein n=1 Tax=Aulographum hederae CBS 113979 TaxID=1176131 RepID=A0A6G1H3M4_9PEZI|nr:hypothetical protein K402DRAFT_44927 [Aulographum hederae CBS 113979]